MQDTSNHYIYEYATGTGKTKIALDKIASLYTEDCKILICVPRNVLKTNWKAEIEKWKYDYMLKNITFSTYVSVPKQNTEWDFLVLDEGHHLSRRCVEAICHWKVQHALVLSATLKRDTKDTLKWLFKGITTEKLSTSEAIDRNILPNIRFILYELKLNPTVPDRLIIKNSRVKNPIIHINYTERWKFWKNKNVKIHTHCTQRQYYDNLCSEINWYQSRSNAIYLRKCNDRLKWLGCEKTDIILELLNKLKYKRVLTFCPSIEQSQKIGNSINSKNGTACLDDFNRHFINHISAINMLDEGSNLVDCQIGILNMINSSDRITIQRIGRILRHKHPIIIIPYYKQTREAEIVKSNIIDVFDKDSIVKITDIKELTL